MFDSRFPNHLHQKHQYLNWPESFLAMEEVTGSSPVWCSILPLGIIGSPAPFEGVRRKFEPSSGNHTLLESGEVVNALV